MDNLLIALEEFGIDSKRLPGLLSKIEDMMRATQPIFKNNVSKLDYYKRELELTNLEGLNFQLRRDENSADLPSEVRSRVDFGMIGRTIRDYISIDSSLNQEEILMLGLFTDLFCTQRS